MKSADFILLDAARMALLITEAKALNPAGRSLYTGTPEEPLHQLAPHIFSFTAESDFDAWWQANGWGKSWGMLVSAPGCSLLDIFDHFQKFLKQKNPAGKELYFRFYDPRVLRKFLPSLDILKLQDFFGPVQRFICEEEDPAFALMYSIKNGKLLLQKEPAKVVSAAVLQAASGNEQSTENEAGPDTDTPAQAEKAKRRFFY